MEIYKFISYTRLLQQLISKGAQKCLYTASKRIPYPFGGVPEAFKREDGITGKKM
jgi:hypothetical protein